MKTYYKFSRSNLKGEIFFCSKLTNYTSVAPWKVKIFRFKFTHYRNENNKKDFKHSTLAPSVCSSYPIRNAAFVKLLAKMIPFSVECVTHLAMSLKFSNQNRDRTFFKTKFHIDNNLGIKYLTSDHTNVPSLSS